MIILDLDNCISDDRMRIPLIDWFHPDRDKVFERYHLDAINDPAHVEEFQDCGEPIVILTSRPQAYEQATKDWLEQHKVRWLALAMRPHGNRLPSPALKVCALTALSCSGALRFEDVRVAYDDRLDVLEAYCQIGLNAVQRKIHDIPYGGLV